MKVETDLRAVMVGDTVVRQMGPGLNMELKVTAMDNDFIYCGGDGGWKFHRYMGYEVDEDLGWGVPNDNGTIRTGSWIRQKDRVIFAHVEVPHG